MGDVGIKDGHTSADAKPSRRRKSAALNLDDLPLLLGFHVRLAHIAIYRDFMEAVRPLDMTQRQGAILILIGTNPGTSQAALAEFLNTDRATMMAMIDRLETRNLIERRKGEADKRTNALYLTDTGRVTLAELKKLIVGHEKHFLKRFTTKELAQFTEFLTRVHGKL